MCKKIEEKKRRICFLALGAACLTLAGPRVCVIISSVTYSIAAKLTVYSYCTSVAALFSRSFSEEQPKKHEI